MRATLLALCAAALAAAQDPPPPPVLAGCGGAVAWSSLSVSPAQPKAGLPVVLNATGAASAAVGTGGTGNVTAYLWGMNVWSAPVAACGANQTLDVDGFATLTFNGLACPLAAGAPAALSVSLTVPAIAAGMGQIAVVVGAYEGSELDFCLNMTLNF